MNELEENERPVDEIELGPPGRAVSSERTVIRPLTALCPNKLG